MEGDGGPPTLDLDGEPYLRLDEAMARLCAAAGLDIKPIRDEAARHRYRAEVTARPGERSARAVGERIDDRGRARVVRVGTPESPHLLHSWSGRGGRLPSPEAAVALSTALRICSKILTRWSVFAPRRHDAQGPAEAPRPRRDTELLDAWLAEDPRRDALYLRASTVAWLAERLAAYPPRSIAVVD